MRAVRLLVAVGLVCVGSLIGVSGASAASAKGSPIVIGTICTCSGPQGAGLAGVKQVMTGWQKYTNANGGLNGHPVKVIFKDDKGDAAAAATAARSLVDSKVLAIVGNFSQQQGAWAKIAQNAGIPVIGSPGLSPEEYTNPNFYPVGANSTTTLYHVLSAAAKAKKLKVATLYCTEAPTCGQLKAIIGGFVKTVGGGVKVVSSSSVSASQPSYASVCLAAKNAGANAAIIFQSSNVTTRIIRECAQQGWKPTQFGANGSIPHNDPAAFAKSSVVLNLPTIGIDDKSTAGGKLFQRIIARYAPNLRATSNFTENLSAPFASLQLFAKVATKAKLKPTSTTTQVKNGLYSLKNETLGGLVGPLTYKRGKPTFNGCVFHSAYNGSRWVADPKPFCMTQARIALLLKNLGG